MMPTFSDVRCSAPKLPSCSTTSARWRQEVQVPQNHSRCSLTLSTTDCAPLSSPTQQKLDVSACKKRQNIQEACQKNCNLDSLKMSTVDKKSSECYASKPRYVKELNFDQRLRPNLKPMSLDIFNEQFGQNVDSADKNIFVNDWLKQNKHHFFEKDNEDDYPCSPFVNSKIIKRTPGSPILGNLKKRRRRILSSRETTPASEKGGNSNLDFESSCFSNGTEQSGSRPRRSEENRQPSSSSSSLSCLQSPSNGKKSPVLNDKIRLRKLRQKRLSERKSKKPGSVKLDNSFNSEFLKSESTMTLEKNHQIPKMLVIVKTPDKNSEFEEREVIQEKEIENATFYEEEKIEREIIIQDRKMKEEEVNQNNLNESFIRNQVCDQVQFNSFKMSAKESCFIVRKSPKVFRDNKSTFIEDDSETETEETQSDFIEDVDTPDVGFVNVNTVKQVPPVILQENIPVFCHSPSKDSDETFFSGAVSCQSQYKQQLSQKISEISSSKIKPDSLSQNNYIISMETASPNPFVQSFVNISRNEEKKRKVKKGSLAAKLQTLVNRERSFMRMYQHKMSQKTFQNDNVQFVDLCIQRYYISYNKQFTECCLIADTHNLLKNLINLQTEPYSDLQTANSKKLINNSITVMTIPEIVGTLIAKKGYRLKVYPPWQILDQENIILNVTCFTLDDKVTLKINQEPSSESLKSKIIQTFDCCCIQEGRVIKDCSHRFDTKKPNVIKEMFNIL